MAEARTVAPAKGKDGKDGDAEGGKKKLGKKKLMLLAGLAVLVLAAAAYWFLFMKGGSADAAPEEEPAPEPGTVVSVEPISINLADGHYLKLGIALQQTAEVAESVDGSKALDAAITLYSGKSMTELADPTTREAVKDEFKKTVEHDYEDEVMDVYFTQYVMQ